MLFSRHAASSLLLPQVFVFLFHFEGSTDTQEGESPDSQVVSGNDSREQGKTRGEKGPAGITNAEYFPNKMTIFQNKP